ncbi:MAG: hypothetical protein LBD03_03260 [Methanobrevibacter sp.]|nr:hypothetical protein [Candidatus Methanovirga procula]
MEDDIMGKVSVVNVHISDELKNKFKSYCAGKGRSMSEDIRWYICFRCLQE